MSALQKWKIRILSFEKQLLSKNLLSNNVLQPQMQFDSNCHNNTNAVKANRTFQMGKNKNECKEIGLKQYQWPINPSSSTHRFRQEEVFRENLTLTNFFLLIPTISGIFSCQMTTTMMRITVFRQV